MDQVQVEEKVVEEEESTGAGSGSKSSSDYHRRHVDVGGRFNCDHLLEIPHRFSLHNINPVEVFKLLVRYVPHYRPASIINCESVQCLPASRTSSGGSGGLGGSGSSQFGHREAAGTSLLMEADDEEEKEEEEHRDFDGSAGHEAAALSEHKIEELESGRNRILLQNGVNRCSSSTLQQVDVDDYDDNDDDDREAQKGSLVPFSAEEQMLKCRDIQLASAKSHVNSHVLWPGHDAPREKVVDIRKENLQGLVLAAGAKGFAGRRRGFETRYSGSGLREVLDWQQVDDHHHHGEDHGHEVSDTGLRETVSRMAEEEQEEEEKRQLINRSRSTESMNSMEVVFRGKVNQVAMHVDGLRKRLERAEKMVADLRLHSEDEETSRSLESAHALSLQSDMEELRDICAQKDEEKRDLLEWVNGLQELCMNHEKSIHGLRQALKNLGMADANKPEAGSMNQQLQRELYRLSGVEVALRSELEAARREITLSRCENKSLIARLHAGHEREAAKACSRRLDQELRAQLYRSQAQVTALQEKYDLLAIRLRLAMRHRRSTKEVMRESEERFARMVEDNKSLRLELARTRRSLRARENDVHNLERQVDAIMARNHMLQATLSLQDKTAAAAAGLADLQSDKLEIAAANEAQHMSNELELRDHTLESNENQLQLLPAVSKANQNTSCSNKVGLVPSMEQALLQLTSIVSSQNSCIVRVSTQNEELARASQLHLQQIEDLLQSATAAIKSRKERDQLVDQLKEQLAITEYWPDRAQRTSTVVEQLPTSNCDLMLQEYALTLEEDLRQSQAHCTLLLQDQEELRLERYELVCSLADSYLRLSELEKEVNSRVELMKELEADLERSTLEIQQNRKQFSLVTRERDELRKEGEMMSREALRMSLEVELLRRRLRQLDEELLLKDGQISILRSNWEDDDDQEH